jgi:rubredoxin
MASFKMYFECPKCQKRFESFLHGTHHYCLTDVCPRCGTIKDEFKMVSSKKLSHWYAPWTWIKKRKWQDNGYYSYKTDIA